MIPRPRLVASSPNDVGTPSRSPITAAQLSNLTLGKNAYVKDTFSAHVMTQVDSLHKLGILGGGVKVRSES